MPFSGVDIWKTNELSWLNSNGLLQVVLGEFIIPCGSEYLIESKSFKLYLNSINQEKFKSITHIREKIKNDLSQVVKKEVTVNLVRPEDQNIDLVSQYEGFCLDNLNVKIDTYQVNEGFLKTTYQKVDELLYSRLLKSNCPVTNQPDWETLIINYSGKKIDRKGLLKYIISFRSHNGFQKNCVEQIYLTLTRICSPEKLSI